jgi:hypothetical protein
MYYFLFIEKKLGYEIDSLVVIGGNGFIVSTVLIPHIERLNQIDVVK